MKNKFLNKKVKIIWTDAVILGPNNWQQKRLTKMQTIGTIIDYRNSYYIIKNPQTIKVKTAEKHPKDKKPKFYAIPDSMVKTLSLL